MTGHRAEEPVTVTSSDEDRGTWCCEFELAGGTAPRGVVHPADETEARVLVRLHGDPLGYLHVPLTGGEVDVPALAEKANAVFASRIDQHLHREGADPTSLAGAGGRSAIPAPGPDCPNRVSSTTTVSVVVCTRDRSSILAACLQRLTALTYAHLEVIVVDNAPRDESTRAVVEAVSDTDPRIRYVLEPRPGLSCARNRGWHESRGTLVAYTDDDVAVDERWVDGLVKGFQLRSDVGCVTGLVCTAGITGRAERYFDARAASWSSRCETQQFDLRTAGDALYPFSPGIFGTGANMAFPRALLQDIGGFDEALGAGTNTRGGEDLDIFVRVLRADRAIAYEPAAIVWHHHRADDRALLDQMYGYGTGLSAFLTKSLLDPDTRWPLLRRIPVGVRRLAGIKRQTNERLAPGLQPPKGALLREFAGFAAGPALYLQARRRSRNRHSHRGT